MMIEMECKVWLLIGVYMHMVSFISFFSLKDTCYEGRADIYIGIANINISALFLISAYRLSANIFSADIAYI